jgi:hypothetical protein
MFDETFLFIDLLLVICFIVKVGELLLVIFLDFIIVLLFFIVFKSLDCWCYLKKDLLVFHVSFDAMIMAIFIVFYSFS